MEIIRDTEYEPYAPTSTCTSDVQRALTVNPVMSSLWLEDITSENTLLMLYDSSTCQLKATFGDTVYQLFIDRPTALIRQMYMIDDSASSILYNALFLYGHTDDSVPYLEAVKLQAAPTFQRGGIEFTNIVVNGRSDISVSGFRGKNPVGRASVFQAGATVRISLPSKSRLVGIYDLAGRMIEGAVSPVGSSGSDYSWSGRDTHGKQVVSGWYSIVWRRRGKRFARLFHHER